MVFDHYFDTAKPKFNPCGFFHGGIATFWGTGDTTIVKAKSNNNVVKNAGGDGMVDKLRWVFQRG